MPDDQRPQSPSTSDSAQTLNEPRSDDGTPLPLSATVFGQTTAPYGAAPTGDRLGRYRILKKLGQGGMGAVFLAQDEELDRRVALKVPQIPPGDNDGLERFLREARAAATLSHPNLCPVYDFGREAATPFLAMAYVEGEPLSERLKQGPLPPAEAAELVHRVATAVEEAHARGVVHRDLKPSNIMLTPRGEPVVMDFGLARRSTAGDARLTHSGMILGTPAYMPPEQAEGDTAHIGPRSDVYSLGVILYECLTGLTPFQGSTGQVIAQVLTRQPPAPSSLRPGLDPRLEAVCLKAMARKPDDRYAGMKAFADALSGWLAAQSAAPVPPRRLRWPWVAGGLAGAALVLLGVLFFLNTRQGKVRIEINDPKAVVLIDGEEVRIEKLGDPITLKPGPHGLVVKRGDVVVHTRDFSVVRGDNPVLKITLEAPAPPPAGNKKPDSPVYEMRVYFAVPGKLDALHARFRSHTSKLFEKHGMTNVGYFTPMGDNTHGKLVYFLAYPSKEARDKAWKAFMSDPRWQEVRTESEKGGPLVARVEQRFLTATNYSPELKLDARGNHVFELRTYTATRGNLAALDTRFRGHTLKLFEKHGMMNVAYWHLLPDQQGAEATLIYLLAHKSLEAAKTSFEAFRQDPEWIKVRTASEVKAGGSLTETKGVTSEFLMPTDYSPLGSGGETEPGGFRPLFNGKDLSGWTVDSGDAEAWKVEEGELVVRANPREQGWLMTTRDYGDFVLRLEFAYTAGANSGVALRAVTGEGRAPGAPQVLEVQLLDDNDPRYARLALMHKTGALHNLALDRPAKLRRVGEWNTLEVEARGSAVRVKVNGAQVLQTDLSNFADQADRIPGLKRSSGRIGLQNWGNGTMRFRKVEVKELSGK